MPLSSDVSVLVRELISANLAWVASEIIEAIELPQPVSVTSGEVKDASPLPSGAPFLLPTHQSGIHRASPTAPCHIRFENVADPSRSYEMHNSVQWLGRSRTTHECDVSVLPEAVATRLRTTGRHPQGLPIAMYECKDRSKPANVDELRFRTH